MKEATFSVHIGQEAIHHPTNTTGRVTGLFVNRHNINEVLIEYTDRNNLVADRWLPESEITGLIAQGGDA